MKYKTYWLIIIILIVSGCLFYVASRIGEDTSSHMSENEHAPARVESTGQKGLNRVTLTERAAERLDIKTVAVSGNQRTVPYSSIIYGLYGETWIYTNPEPFTYIRERVQIDHVDDSRAFLSESLSTNTVVVTVGVPELFGVEHGVGRGEGH